ncbi:hypothetical protein [Prevotella sp. E13-27]|jgi:hypothetical protein|uniref:hypothetical protein n=1 Tax=Prevotella sp. E13-27 TaxID=2938122 RepID=UPI00200A0460|nr:hypothetical protein [Prevotella sp. E13-27]MCK8622629.1 hypothetical protein [Prevotella sp. E13-27]
MDRIEVKGAVISEKVADTIAKLQEKGDTIMGTYRRVIDELLDEALQGDRQLDWEHAGALNMLRKDLEAIATV